MPTESKLLSEMTPFEAHSWGERHISAPYWTEEEVVAELDKWIAMPDSNERIAMIAGLLKTWAHRGEL